MAHYWRNKKILQFFFRDSFRKRNVASKTINCGNYYLDYSSVYDFSSLSGLSTVFLTLGAFFIKFWLWLETLEDPQGLTK